MIERSAAAQSSSRGTPRRPSTMLPAHVSPWLPVWAGLGAFALWIGSGNGFTDFYDSVMMLSLLNLALGLSIFWAGRGMTATNIYGFGFALFVGFAAIYTLTNY